MFRIRQARVEDVDTLLKLARMVFFINLPPDARVIEDKIRWSNACFENVRGGKDAQDSSALSGLTSLGGAAGRSPQFMFVIEDTQTGNPIGCSAVIQQMGSEDSPSVVLRLEKKEFFSSDLQSGTTHVTATRELVTSGPSEIGGLIVAPSFRGHKEKLGKQLSLVRFHYIGLHRERFKDRVIAEMMAPISGGTNPFWEHCARRFINLTYEQADRFCQKSREFMISLIPPDPIYLTLLPTAARECVGKVGDETLPARRMLEKIGFEFTDRVDPFDAGPVLVAETDSIPHVTSTVRGAYAGTCKEAEASHEGMVSIDDKLGFRAIRTKYKLDGSFIQVPEGALELLDAQDTETLACTPF
ncbi:MAG: arginine N-succinyltransferase [Phycisphaerales bacterium JB043]